MSLIELEEKKLSVTRLRRWRGSFTYFDGAGKLIPPSLKAKVDKAIISREIDLVKLKSIEDELIAAVGTDITSAPSQADLILNSVNPLVEGVVTYAGFDVTGFASVAAKTCKDPLILTLIEYDLMNGKRPPPIALLALAYSTTLYGVNAMNAARKAEKKSASASQSEARSESQSEAEVESRSEAEVEEKKLPDLREDIPSSNM